MPSWFKSGPGVKTPEVVRDDADLHRVRAYIRGPRLQGRLVSRPSPREPPSPREVPLHPATPVDSSRPNARLPITERAAHEAPLQVWGLHDRVDSRDLRFTVSPSTSHSPSWP